MYKSGSLQEREECKDIKSVHVAYISLKVFPECDISNPAKVLSTAQHMMEWKFLLFFFNKNLKKVLILLIILLFIIIFNITTVPKDPSQVRASFCYLLYRHITWNNGCPKLPRHFKLNSQWEKRKQCGGDLPVVTEHFSSRNRLKPGFSAYHVIKCSLFSRIQNVE